MTKQLILIGLLLSINTFAQDTRFSLEEEKVNAVIKELFDGYRAGDSSRVAAVFTKNAMMQSIFTTEEGEDKITEAKSVEGFINYIGAGFTEIHDERLWATQIHADHLFATVWTSYAFFLGDKFNHCGTETFLLRKEDHAWKIFYLVDTRKKTDCTIPEEIKK